MNKHLCAVLLGLVCLPYMVRSQGEEKIEYYTDSDVTHSILAVGVNASPYYSGQRLLDEVIGQGQGFRSDIQRAKGVFGYSYGLDLYFKLSSRFDLVLGANNGLQGYAYDNVRIQSGESLQDTINAALRAEIRSVNFPLQLVFRSSLNELWDLEFIPAIELNYVPHFEYRFTAVEGGEEMSRDMNAYAQDWNYTAGIAIGSTLNFTDNWAFFLRANFRYMLRPMFNDDNLQREIIYTIGCITGLKYHF